MTTLSSSPARVLVLLVLVALLAAVPAPTAAAVEGKVVASDRVDEAGADDETVDGSFLVTTSGPVGRLPAAASDWFSSRRGAARFAALTPQVARVEVDPRDADRARRALLALPGVLAVEPERVWSYAGREPNDPAYPEQWAHAAADAPTAWGIETGSAARRIAIVDSGIDGDHPDLAGRVVDRRQVVGAQVRAAAPGTVDNDICVIGHGTMVAGVAAATGDNALGVAGVAWGSSLVDIALSAPESRSATTCTAEEAAPTDGKVVAALGYLADPAVPPVDVVNLSLGGRQHTGRCPASLQSAIDRVRDRGTVVVAAAGNEGDLGLQVPAVCRGVISVAAVARDGQRASYSGLGRYLDVAAPGGESEGVLTTRHRRRTPSGQAPYASPSGTSFAAPYVTGVVALLRSHRPELAIDEVESIIERTALHPRGPGEHDHEIGWGRLQAGAALQMAQAHAPIPPLPVHPSIRLSARSGVTEPIAQAAAVSRSTFAPGSAAHAVIARSDDFADALAGSSLAYGIGPLLFAPPASGLPQATRDELLRSVPPCTYSGCRRRPVYLLGGHAALDPALDVQLRDLGYAPVRLAGRVREETATAVAREMAKPGGVHQQDAIVIATRGNWPDAVAAGSLGAYFGLPILLTPPGELHRITADYLRELRAAGRPMRTVYVVGGEGVVSTPTAQAAAMAAGGGHRRLGGATRDQTAIAVGQELRGLLARSGSIPSYAVAVDLERGDSFAHALSASALAGNTGGVFVPIRGVNAPRRITDDTAAFACSLHADGVVAGDEDLLPRELAAELQDILMGTSPRCS